MENATPLQELEALIKYLINHNESHTKELEELASALKKEGKLEAYKEVLSAVEHYKEGNKDLASSLTKISE